MESSKDYKDCEEDSDSMKAMKSDLRRLRQEVKLAYLEDLENGFFL